MLILADELGSKYSLLFDILEDCAELLLVFEKDVSRNNAHL